MKLFQYWDTADPPAEVARWIEGVRRDNPDLEHELFDRRSAGEFISRHFGERERRAFDVCAVPAMQSDYFRLCALLRFGGVYLDADFQSKAPLSSLLQQAPKAMMLVWENEMVNGLMMFREAGNAFVAACLTLATDNIEARRFNGTDGGFQRFNVRLATGPGLMNAIWALVDEALPQPVLGRMRQGLVRKWDAPELLEHARRLIPVTPELATALGSVTLVHMLGLETWIGAEQPAYKDTSRHWFYWREPLYNDDPPPADARGPECAG